MILDAISRSVPGVKFVAAGTPATPASVTPATPPARSRCRSFPIAVKSNRSSERAGRLSRHGDGVVHPDGRRHARGLRAPRALREGVLGEAARAAPEGARGVE